MCGPSEPGAGPYDIHAPAATASRRRGRDHRRAGRHCFARMGAPGGARTSASGGARPRRGGTPPHAAPLDSRDAKVTWMTARFDPANDRQTICGALPPGCDGGSCIGTGAGSVGGVGGTSSSSSGGGGGGSRGVGGSSGTPLATTMRGVSESVTSKGSDMPGRSIHDACRRFVTACDRVSATAASPSLHRPRRRRRSRRTPPRSPRRPLRSRSRPPRQSADPTGQAGA